jgi:glutamate N-acetyltransferase/amino-acid N-acetyltransferase
MSEFELIQGGGLADVPGFTAGGARGGVKMQNEDVGLLVADELVPTAALFTTNQVKAAPVYISAEHAQSKKARAVVWNSGNANCCTGALGLQNAWRMCELAAQKIGCPPRQVLVCSTGIIGHQLPMEKIESALQVLEAGRGSDFSQAAARAAMTTDTRPKYFAARATIDGKPVTVGGQIKGVGMIGPDMQPFSPASSHGPNGLHATMLAFLATDARIEKGFLFEILRRAVEKSFNSVTVDGDTSTNDTAIFMASGASGLDVTEGTHAYEQFEALLSHVCVELSKMVARDGEGATKLVTIQVEGAGSEADAKLVALTIANSPLVKTAIFGRDPNWGRLAMAAGRAGVSFDPSELRISLGDVEVFRNGEPLNFDQEAAQAAMNGDTLDIVVRVGSGSGSWRAWTCDFSYDYVKINAEYHT